MDFGDILDDWESHGSPGTRKRKKDPEESFEKLLDRYSPGGGAWEPKEADAEKRRADDHWKRMKVQDTVDLHGLGARAAWETLDAFMNASRKRGLVKVLIVHGKGNHSEGDPVLSRIVKEYLENCPFAGRTGNPDRSGGGRGAVWVILKGDYRSR